MLAARSLQPHGLWRFVLVAALSACGSASGETDGDTESSTTEGAASSSASGDVASDASETSGASLYTVGGQLVGLQGAGLTITNNGGEALTLAQDGAFTFPEALADAEGYEVVVTAQPQGPEQTCSVASGVGTVAGADVGDIEIRCVTEIRHVIVLGIDGLGGAYVPTIDTPVLDQLMASAVSTLTMQNALPTMSAPNWMSMIAGVGPDQHGVKSNSWMPGDSTPPPTMFAVVRAQRPDARIGVFHDWEGFGALVEPDVADIMEHPGDEYETMDAALTWLAATRPELLFIHLDHVDHAGHFHTWGSPEYIDAVERADALLGELLAALEELDMLPYSAVLVSADHGGDFYGHGDDTSLERPIPFVVRGPQLAPGTITREVRIWDLAPTVTALLQVEPEDAWIGRPAVDELLRAEDRAPPTPVAPVDVIEIAEYEWRYDDEGSGAYDDVSIWRPALPPGYHLLGDVTHASHAAPTFATIAVAGDDDALRPPLGYEQIWTEEGSGGAHEVGLWNPIPPPGYVCLGTVAQQDRVVAPPLDQIRCLHRGLVVQGESTLTWTDQGSGADEDAGLWTCDVGPAGGASARSFITRRHHDDPGTNRCWSLL